jgi:hypothetical protein
VHDGTILAVVGKQPVQQAAATSELGMRVELADYGVLY